MSATAILAANDCSFARVDEEQPSWLLPPVPAFLTTSDPHTPRVPDGALLPDPRNYTRTFSVLDETAMGYVHAATTVVIATDGDAPGQGLADELTKMIGYATCWRVSGLEGGKDANAVLVKLGAPAMRDALAEASSNPIPASPPSGTRPIRMLPLSRGWRCSVELSPVVASHAC